MRPVIITVLALFGVLIPSSVSAKDLEQFLLRAYVYDEDWNSVDSVSVTLTKNDTTDVPFKLLSGFNKTRINNGNQIRALVQSGLGDYQLTLYKEGYKPEIRHFTIGSISEDLKYLSTVTMHKEYVPMHRTLDEVTVEATRIKMVMKGDTVVFNANAFNLSEGSMLETLVKQLPNTEVNEDGVISVNGRKVNELLLNGKDFFKGNPKVALQNLPAYTVRNIKVYDKKAEDAYLTHSDARIDTREEDQNMVMDVMLKKEYQVGWMGNLSGGYGTHDRYMGRAFALGYTDKFRLSMFTNINNISDQSSVDDGGSWYNWTNKSGDSHFQKFGADYSYQDNKKWRGNGQVNYSNERSWQEGYTSSTLFYPTGYLYRRDGYVTRARYRDFNTSHNWNLNMRNVAWAFGGSARWYANDNKSNSRQATFASEPQDDAYRGQVLDSIFSSNILSSSYYRNLLTATHRLSNSKNDNRSGNVYLNATIRPASWKGYLTTNVSGQISNGDNKSHIYMVQTYGAANTDTGRPLNRDQWSESEANRKSMDGLIKYKRDLRTFGEKSTKTISYEVGAQGRHSYDSDPYTQFLGPDSLDAGIDILPSMVAPAGMIMQLAESYRSRTLRNEASAVGSLSYATEPTAPGDSTFNASWTYTLNAMGTMANQQLDYMRPERQTEQLSSTKPVGSVSGRVMLRSNNKARSINSFFEYRVSLNDVPLTSLLQGRVSSNPLQVYMPGGALKQPLSHRFYLYSYRYTRAKHGTGSIYASLEANINTNQVASANYYNRETGVTTYTPTNINGNWNIHGNFQGNHGFLKEGALRPYLSLDVNLTKSVDYQTLETTPVRSAVMNYMVTPGYGLTWTIKDKGYISFNGYLTWRHATGDRPGFVTINTQLYSNKLSADYKLPGDIRLSTSLSYKMMRNMTDSNLNTDEWLWNASVEKSLLKNGALNMKLEWIDILNADKSVNIQINAQGRVESWNYKRPGYAMLTVGYRFDMKPKGNGSSAAPAGGGRIMVR